MRRHFIPRRLLMFHGPRRQSRAARRPGIPPPLVDERREHEKAACHKMFDQDDEVSSLLQSLISPVYPQISM